MGLDDFEDVAFSIRVETGDDTVEVPFDYDPSDLSGQEWEAMSRVDLTALPTDVTNEQALACAVIWVKARRHHPVEWDGLGPVLARLMKGDGRVVEVA